MTKKGKCSSNVANEEVIATLIIQSEDLVQVVAKREMLPADGFVGHETGDVTGAVACTFPSNGNPLKETNKMTNKSNVGQPHTNKTKGSSGTENGLANVLKPDIVVQSTNALQVNKNADTVLSAPSATVSSSTPFEAVTTKVSTSNRAPKEFKLNPGAKTFSPSFPNKRSATPQAIPSSANLAYIPDNYHVGPVASPQPEFAINPYAPRSVPAKFVPYGGNDVQHPPPILGYRSQPVRNGGQYHLPVQTAPAYVQPSPQNVMVGRLGPVVYVHPVSQDMVPGTNGFPQMSTCSILTPHQVHHVPKHQGNATAQALQLCAPSSFIGGGGQPPFVMPTHIPISQPPYPMIRPISVPGSNGFFVSKFS